MSKKIRRDPKCPQCGLGYRKPHVNPRICVEALQAKIATLTGRRRALLKRLSDNDKVIRKVSQEHGHS